LRPRPLQARQPAPPPGKWQGKWQGKYDGRHYSHRHHGPGPGAIAGAAIFGLAFGALAAPLVNPYPYPYYYYPPVPLPQPVYPAYAYNPHVAWCSAQYQSYNPVTNTWVDFSGVVQVCYSP
jgi:hypothetical protein